MSRESVEVVRSVYSALAGEGVEAALEFVDPEFEVTTPRSLASEPDTYRGHDGIRRYFASFGDAMDDVRLEGREFTSVGDKVLAETTLHARGRTTGLATEQHAFLVWTLRNGMLTRLEAFPDEAQALEAAQGRE
jgi:uncharacterized protein